MPGDLRGTTYADLDSFLHKDETGSEEEEEKSKKVVETLHKILRPFLLRRVKSDVEKNLLPIPPRVCCCCHRQVRYSFDRLSS